MDQQTRWDKHYQALIRFSKREGHPHVPVGYRDEEELNLGNWVSYMRLRKRQNLLQTDRIIKLEAVPNWAWDRTPGPARDESKIERDAKIVALYSNGHSLQDVAEIFELSRQRIHQIVKAHTNGERTI